MECPASFPWMSYNEAHAYEAKAREQKVSRVARSPRGFMRQFEKTQNIASFCRKRVDGYPNQTWGRRRHNFIARHLKQFKKNPTERRWLAMVMWAYKAPTPKSWSK